jgi:hypothetical protein
MNQKTRPKTMEMYDVNSYTEEELINNILDLNNPTDRELEHKILSLYNRYQIIETKQGQQLAKFFKDIYDRFFDDDDDTDGTDYDDDDEQNEQNEQEDNIDEIEGFESTPTMTPTMTPRQRPTMTPLNYTWSTPKPANSNVIPTTGNLNPTIKDTIKRIISIDSQYRDDKRTMSTNFTFSLSENLRDVVSLKLYSIQIPQTWYTVPKSYGCNFFYLKGNSRGIDNGYHDYTIDISAGNYTANDLIKALNTKIQELKKTFPDVSFGNTNIGYNPNAALTTLSINMNNTYNESGYYLYFPTWTPSKINNLLSGPRYKSIPGFLGFNYRNYYLNRIYSTATLPLSTDIAEIETDNTEGNYSITQTNNYFTIYKYIGPNEYSLDSVVDLSFQIKLSLTGTVTRTQIVTDLSNQLASNQYLNGSSIQRIDITDPLSVNDGHSFFQLTINYNRSKTNNIVNSKTYIEFPTETDTPKIWTGNNSCFHFQNTKNELNNVVSEISPITQQSGKYVITPNLTPGKYPNPYIYLSCVKPQYNVIENNYIIDLPNSNAGYNIAEYFAAINNGIVVANNRTITSKNTSGDFNLQNFRAYIGPTSKFNIEIDINRKFTRDMYRIDLTGTFLESFIGLSGEYLDGQKDLLGSTYTFTSSFQEDSFYEVSSDTMLKALPSILNYGNQNAELFTVRTKGIGTIYSSYQQLESAINDAFTSYRVDGSYVFSGTNIVMTPNGFTGLIECVFTIEINKTITQKDYTISFIDEKAEKDGENILLSTSTWSNNLNVEEKYLGTGRVNGIADNSYNLSLIETETETVPYTTITAKDPITVNVISFIEGENNFFVLIPWEEGVATGPPYYANDNHANDIKITIPAVNNLGKINYTRDNLITTINQLLNDRDETKGSSIQIIKVSNSEYTKFRFNVNKVYSAYDYKLVFYDQLSFNKCSPGAQYIQNTTWDTTIGWLIGFHNNTEFALSDYGTPGAEIQIVGDTTATVNLFDYFLLCVDDYNQNRLNDGLVRVSSAERSFSMPAYANKANYVCDPTTGLLTYNATAENTVDYNRLTQNQLYSLTQLANSKSESSIITSTPNVYGISYSSGLFADDVFGFIPMKTVGLTPGAVYVDYGGTLQNQERSYFGPVNISKLGIKLVSNRGDVIDLNGSNWSFSFMVEQLYQQKQSSDKKKT